MYLTCDAPRNDGLVLRNLVASADSRSKADHEDDSRECRGEAHLAQPCKWIEGKASPAARLLRGLQCFLEAHTGRRQQVRSHFKLRRRVHRFREAANCLQLQRTFRTPPCMLVHFVLRVIREFVVDIQRYVFFHPFAIHTSCLCSSLFLPEPLSISRPP